MIRTLLLVSVVLATASGCRKNHLGPDTNVAYRTAFAAQRTSEPDRAPTFGADDAKASLASRRTSKGKAGASTMPAPGSILMPSLGAGAGNAAPPSSGGWPGAKGSMSLEAK
jgi:hypothetical protein